MPRNANRSAMAPMLPGRTNYQRGVAEAAEDSRNDKTFGLAAPANTSYYTLTTLREPTAFPASLRWFFWF
jgi:hypothetical protein